MNQAIRSMLAFGTLCLLENAFPLRRRREPLLPHLVRNLCVAAGAAAVVTFVELPITRRCARIAEERRVGLVQWIRLREPLRTAVAMILSDYAMYWWHIASHRFPLLWRFHIAHHIDRDLDASTALRFHSGEMLASVPWTAFTVLLIGTPLNALRLWQSFFFAEVVFHHANLRLPAGFERTVNRFLVTPRMHGIHHADTRANQHSNFSSGLTLWDWVHGTLKLGVPQNSITIGILGYQREEDVSLMRTLAVALLWDGREGFTD